MSEYEESLAAGTSLAISIDEFSMVDACRLYIFTMVFIIIIIVYILTHIFFRFGQILRRIEEMESEYFKTQPKSPRLFILTGVSFLL